MSSHSKLFVFGIILQVSIALVAAQSTPGAAGETTTTHSMPFIAEVLGTDVNVRSGPGTSYYYTGKVNAPGKVTVVGEQTGWYEIIPPVGSFSWISKDYVDLDPANPGIGMVNDDGVNIWAGSDYREPVRSASLQVKLNKGDIVKLINPGAQEGSYYKIVPPPGAHLWISRNFLRYVESIRKPSYKSMFNIKPEVTPVIKPEVLPAVKPEVKPVMPEVVVKPVVSVAPAEPNVPPGTRPGTAPEATGASRLSPQPPSTAAGDGSVEEKRVKECYALAKQITEELKKPLDAQDYSEYKRALTVIINDPQAGKAVRYARYQLAQIGRFELAQQADQNIKKQDSALARLRQEIKDKYAARVAAVPNPGKYIIKGRIEPSLVYTGQSGTKRYKILNDAGKIICYAVPAAGAGTTGVENLLGHKVGLVGTIVTDKANPVGLVTFTAIEELTDTASSKNLNKPDTP